MEETIYHASNAYVLRKIAGESVLVSVGSGVADFCGIINLNASASVLWECLQQGATKQDLIQRLVNEFGISVDVAAEDADKTLNLLTERGMIVCG